MVSNRCKTIVKNELEKLNIQYVKVDIGEVTIEEKLTSELYTRLAGALQKYGFEMIGDEKNDLIEELKTAIVDLENYSDEDLKTSYSDYIKLQVKDNFISINTLFEEIKGITIEKYIINHKIELAKALLQNNDLSLDEIAVKMHYSNTVQLSSQFKDITGLTPSHYRQLRQNSNNNRDSN